ncbi:hypothetical protein A9X84_11290 [Brachyspira hyodysenteriae]|nr:hypothetical protein SR30_07940 [Brachyspira hyodysenteriae]KLI35062.1 hypothetical protein SZ50_04665 [Brachyspira hyodysenteriae]TVL42590.1 hypothetical protein A9X84_11290 [Brachyspira hyodysenteriae]TVL71233.1 hypothetical protein A9X77_04990 [Brachyspira hyodysenteriae]TVL87056.1 hypothetical protein A9X78_11485 [Brachyspira hyodysenteriae]
MGLLNDFTKKLIPNFLYTDSLKGKVGEFEVDNALNPLFLYMSKMQRKIDFKRRKIWTILRMQ